MTRDTGRSDRTNKLEVAALGQLESLVQNAPLAIALLDKEYRVLLWNPAAERLLGWEAEEVLGKALPSVPGEHLHATRDFVFQKLERGEPVTGIEVERIRADGSRVLVELSATGLRNEVGELEKMLFFMQSLEERRAAALERLRFEAMIESCPDFISLADPEGRVLFLNRAGRELLGIGPEFDVTTRQVSDFRAEAADAPTEQEILTTLLRDGAWIGESVLVGNRGERIEVDERSFMVRHEGQHIAFATYLRPNRRRKELEAQLVQAQKMEAVGRLAGGVAHDFNNLLTVIRTCSEFALAELEADHPLREDLEQIQGAAERAAMLTRQLLLLSKRQVAQPRAVDLAETAEGALRLLRRSLGEDVRVVTSLPPGEAIVEADPGLLEQVLINLALNARDAMPNGGTLRISVGTIPAEGTEPPRAFLNVEDEGVGMDEGTRRRIFEPFFTTKAQGRGTGLGLPTVLGIVQQAHGQIAVQSAPGTGTRFEVTFPLHSRPQDDSHPERIEPLPEGRGDILVVEDEEMVRHLVIRVLRSCGYTVHEAEDGVTALRLAAELPRLDLILTDVVMPGMSGPALAQAVRERRPGLRFLLMSDYTADEMRRHTPGAEALPLLEKPFAPIDLARRIRDLLP